MIKIAYRVFEKGKPEESITAFRKSERKTTYATWACSRCRASFFYRVAACPLCESGSIQEMTHSVSVIEE